MSLVRERLYYEIALSIGNSLDLREMLNESLATYLRKTNCLAGAVLRQEEVDGLWSFKPVFTIPKRIKQDSVLKAALDQIPRDLDPASCARYLAGLPRSGVFRGYKRHILELPDFGLLLLLKSSPGLAERDIRYLTGINTKLACSCLSCQANEQLNREIREREKVEKLYRDIVDNSLDGMYQVTLDGRYLHVNPSLAYMFGYKSPEEMIARVEDVGLNHYVHPEDRRALLDGLKTHKEISQFDFQYRRLDGSTGWVSTSARLKYDQNGNPLFVEGACRDVTQAKQAEAALREAKLAAERLSQMKSNLISTVSHELRTPLTSILGFSKIIRKRLSSLGGHEEFPKKLVGRLEQVTQNVDVIISEGERLTELVNNVLDLAKLEAGHYEWNMTLTSIGEVLNHSLTATEILFQSGNVMLTGDIPDDLPMVMGDHDRLIQVVINLISNGAKFTETGEVRVSARKREDFVEVRVSDTGLGVKPEERGLIFERFRQLDNTLKGKPRGTGLGLPICKEIVEHHGGTIWYEPEPSGGSAFIFTLPTE